MFQSVNSLHSNVFLDKVAIVTGAGHGIGRGICEAFASQGAHVIAVDILEEPLEQTKQFIVEKRVPGTVHTFKVDLTQSDQIQTFVEEVATQFSRVDILVNNAGGVVGQVHQPIEEVTDEEWEKVVGINLNACFYMIRAVAPFMKKQQYGRIVNISSGAGRSSSLTGIQAYTSAKAGQIGLTRQMARELGPYGITVNNVAPGFVLSNPSTEKQWERMGKEKQEQLIESISVKRLGKPEDIAYPVLFFASDYASYVSGQIISADGGLQLF
ncbi:SDR family NAD(P)-dependent oxidoreductase [Bacillus sp. 31A1R]|uniref:SDR family NAD(P)-dependent oxidoreductase n=1 Tax=Robertmurraya mangrovi TaxID=3098077 RepID=A0ABU5IW31_9BACI|nr:SDR family NAD(P)-dependent oxidoreductase [Bacillus sp. 31A1R]MDZ5471316.1 SDR family NAD(P)-dependent oxidoreductase [Bacillus sp. 31A1R]